MPVVFFLKVDLKQRWSPQEKTYYNALLNQAGQ